MVAKAKYKATIWHPTSNFDVIVASNHETIFQIVSKYHFVYIYFINLQYFNLHKKSALYKLLWILLIWILSSTRPFLTLSDRRFWLGRANPDGGRKDCRHVDHGQDVTGIQDANVERRCQEVHKLDHGKGQFDSNSVRWKSFLFWQHRSPKSYKVRADLSWVLYHLCNFN